MLPALGGRLLRRGVEKALLSRLAAIKRGRFTYVESPEVIEQRIGRLFDQIESPALVGLTLTFARTGGVISPTVATLVFRHVLF